MFNEMRMRFGITAALLAALALALPAFASAEPLGSGPTYYNSVLRENAVNMVVTAGPDGNVWFVDNQVATGTPLIGKITSSGTITEYTISGLNAGSDLTAITAGPDGNLWITDRGTTAAIAAVNPATPTKLLEEKPEFSPGLNAGSKPEGIVAGPDGNLWFADNGTTKAIGVINPSTHVIEEFSTGLNAGANPQGIAAGPDGSLWFTDTGTTKAVGKINPSTHVIEEFATGAGTLPGGGNQPFGPWGIAAGADGNVWFTNAQAPESSVCRITPSGTITCFKSGLLASSKPNGLTAVPGSDKLWFKDVSGVNEVQELEVNATENLGGTYKLVFGGKETGWTGSGNVMHTAKGAGEVKRFTSTNCKRTSTSKELKECTTVTGAEVGMLITGTGIPVETTIEKVEEVGKKIFLTNAATSGTGTNTTVTAGRVKNLTVESGTFEVGQPLTTTASNFPAGTIILSISEEGGKKTIVPSKAPSSANATATIEGNVAKTTLTNVSTSSGASIVGETISGTGILAGTTITAINTAQKTLTLSAEATAEGTGVSLSADLDAFAKGSIIQEALQKLTTIGNEGASANGTGVTPPIKRTITFEIPLGNTDVEQMTCNGAGLTGTSPTCSVTTTTAGVPNALGSISTSSGAITRYPDAGLRGDQVGLAGGITNGPGGNVWFATGVLSASKLGKFGSGDPKLLTVKKTGSGSGTVTSSISGINCGGKCETEPEFIEGTEVTLSASAEAGSVFGGWSGSGCSGTGTCKVTMSAAKEVTAEFKKGPTNRRTLTLTKSPAGDAGAGLGSVSSKPKGIKCAMTCSEAVGRFFKEQAVILTAVPSGEGSSFDKWEGCPEPVGLVCTVPAGKADKSVKAVFKGSSKAFTPAEALTLSKGESEQSFGWGTVKATGLVCEAECDVTTALYQGPITEPKPKAGKTVELKETPAFGSKFVGWSGACSGTETSCKVEMSEAKSVTAEFADLPDFALKVEKAYSGGLGAVSSKAKGINCAATCTATSANMPEGTSVLLTAKPATTTPATTFVKWEGGDCEGKTELTCTVGMDKAETVKAVFSGSVKAITNPKSLTLSKEGSGYGTVKATGLTCEVLCTTATSLYYGPVTEPKIKAGAKVILKATPAPGSTVVTWSGCTPLNATECEVVMETNASVTAKFDELE